MSIPFTQYLRPDGRQQSIFIKMPDEIEVIARSLIEAEYHFDAEVLTTGLISLTCENDDDLLAIELCENGPQVITAVESLVRKAMEAREALDI